jgi:D-alanyl-D-alanine carboxypeptidase
MARLQKVLDRTAQHGVAGIQAAVLLDDGSLWTGQAGDSVVKTNTPVDSDTVFSIASITKTFVTGVVMQLVAEGKLSLNDHLGKWVPTVPNAQTITVAELLGHTSGIYNYFENPHYNPQVFSNPKRRWTFDEIMALVRSPYCKPGACYHYSNTNFVLLGRIVELVTGHSLADEIASRLSTPLSLTSTGLQPDDPTPADRAHAYLGKTDWTRKSALLPTVSAATVANAAGAMVSTASDLATWAHALYGGDVVPQAQLQEMESFKKCHDNYGLGTRKLIINGRVAIGHLGSLRGYTDEMLTFPAEGATVVILSNQGNWGIDRAMSKLTDTLWQGIGAPPPQFDPSMNTTIHDGVTLYCRQGSPP